MQKDSSNFQITSAQFMQLSKRCAIIILVSSLIWAAAGASLLEAGFVKASSRNWQAGWSAWKAADWGTALHEWSKDGIITDFTPRPARTYYWRIQALTKLGRINEAESLKTKMARKYPFDYYTFLLFPNGGASAYSSKVYLKLAKIFYPRMWAGEVSRASMKTGVSEELIWAVMRRESKFQQYAISSVGAVGLMQLMPSTAGDIIARLGIEPQYTDLNQPDQNVLLGASYITQLVKRFGGDLPKAVAAYNAGAANVAKWNSCPACDWIEWIEDIPYAQTREYVRSVLANREVYLIISGRSDLPRLASTTSRPLTPSAFVRRTEDDSHDYFKN